MCSGATIRRLYATYADGATQSNTGVSPPNVCNTLYSGIIPVYIYIAI